MAIESDLQIFISWSGDLAREVTKVLRSWLPKMFDHIDPWASEVDIDAGLRGLDVIQDRLNVSSFGIIVVTTENMSKPWLNFEAGALSRRLDADLNRVVPLLVNFDDVYQLQGPISQFQAVKLDKEGMNRLTRSIAAVIKLDWKTIESRFEWAWPDLEAEVEKAKDAAGKQPAPPNVSEKDLLASVLRYVQSLDRKVSSINTAVPLAHIVESGVLPNRKFHGHAATVDPWADPEVMQRIIDEVSAIAGTYKPVRSVGTTEYRGRRVVGIVFSDGQGMSEPGDFNKLMKEVRHLPVTVAVLSDRELGQQP